MVHGTIKSRKYGDNYKIVALVVISFFMVIFFLPTTAYALPDNKQTFSGYTISGDQSYATSPDSYFVLTPYAGNIMANPSGAYILDSTGTKADNYLEVNVSGATLGGFQLQSATIGEYYNSVSAINNYFTNVYVVGYVNGTVVAQTTPYSSVDQGSLYESNYPFDYTSFQGKQIDRFRVYYTAEAGTKQTAFNLVDFTISNASTIPPGGDLAAPSAPSALDLATASDSGSSSTDNVTSNTTLTISGTAEAGSTVTLYDTNGTTVLGTTTTDGSGNWIITSSTLSAGSHSLTAKATDAAGNVSTASSAFVISIDSAAPAAPSAPNLATASDTGSSSTDKTTSDTTPTVSGTAEAGSTVTLYDTNGTTVLGTANADGSGNWSITSSMLSDGTHTLTAKAKDTAGNVSTASTMIAITMDTGVAAPSALDLATASDSGSSSTDNVTSNTTPTISGMAEAGSAVTLYDTNGTTVLGATTADGSGNWSITSSTLSAGSHSLTAKVIDVAGNVSIASSSLIISVDIAGPATPSAPDLAITSDTGSSSIDNTTSDTTPTVSGTAEAGSTVTLYDTNGTTVLGSATVDGSSNWSITSSTLSAGSHSLTVKETDVAGNVSTASMALAIVIDTTAPAAPSAPDLATSSDSGSSSTDNITSYSTPTMSGTAVADSTVKIYDTDGTTILGSTTSDGSGSWSLTASTLSAGSHSITAKAEDVAGNISTASVALVITVDISIAAPSALDLNTMSDLGSSSTDNITSDTTPMVSGAAEAGSTVTLYDTDGATVLGNATTDGSGNWSITSSALSAGSHSLTVKARDAAGNVSTVSMALAIDIDTSAPAAPSAPVLATSSDSGSSSTDNITSYSTPTISGTAAAGSTVKIYDTDGTTILGGTTTDGSGNWSLTASTLSVGSHSIIAKAEDAAGNVSTASVALAITIDISVAAPSAPDLIIASDSGPSSTDNVTSNTNPTLSGTAEAGSTVSLYDTDGTTVLGSTTTDGSDNWSITSSTLFAGAHTLTAKAADVAGNVSTISSALAISIDTAAPAAPSEPDLATGSDTGSSSTDNTTSDTTPMVSGTVEAGSTVKIYDTDGTTILGSTTSDGSGNWSITSATLSVGTHTLTAKATDTAGNVSTDSTMLAITIDTGIAAPSTPELATASDLGSSSTDNITSDTTPMALGTAEPGSTVTLYDTDGTTVLGSTTTDGSSNWSITVSTLSAGTYTLTAKAVDAAGNVSTTSSALTISIDTAAPASPSAPDLATGSDTGSSSSDNTTSDTTPMVSGTAEAGSTMTLYDTNGTTVLGTVTSDGSGNWSITSSALSVGAHTLTVKATDAAGNVSIASSALVISIDTTVPAAPSIPDLPTASQTGSSTTDIIRLTVDVKQGDTDNTVSQITIERATDTAGNTSDTVNFEEEKASETIKKLIEEGKDVARIVLSDIEDEVSETTINIPYKSLEVIAEGDINLQIDTEEAKIDIPKASLQSVSDSMVKDLYFKLVPIKKQEQKENITRRALFDVRELSGETQNSLSIIGTPMTIETNMPSTDVDITLPLTGITIPTDPSKREALFKQLAVYIEHSDGTKELVQGVIVEYKVGMMGIKFNITKFSIFSVIKTDIKNKPANGDITKVITPAKAVISDNKIIATVSNKTTSLTIKVSVSDKATWKLYGDKTCTKELVDNTMNLKVGSNKVYLKVTAEDGTTSKVYTLTITRQKVPKKVIVIATKYDFTDAFAGGVLAGQLGGNVICTGISEKDAKKVVSYIKKNYSKQDEIYIIGLRQAVKGNLEKMLKKEGYTNIVHIGGKDKYETAKLIAYNIKLSDETKALIVNGKAMPKDAQNIQKICAELGYPILFVETDNSTTYTIEALKKINPTQIYIVGDKTLISTKVVEEIVEKIGLDKKDIIRIGTGKEIK